MLRAVAKETSGKANAVVFQSVRQLLQFSRKVRSIANAIDGFVFQDWSAGDNPCVRLGFAWKPIVVRGNENLPDCSEVADGKRIRR